MTSSFALLVVSFCIIEHVAGHFPEEGEEFEGDIVLLPDQMYAIMSGQTVTGRASAKDQSRLWLPNKVVPYSINTSLTIKPEATWGIMAGIREWETYTCLRFTRHTDEANSIHFFDSHGGCWSYVGRVGGKQLISLSDGCYGVGTTAHEIAHAMGVWHEQSRPDRDDFLKVIWANIEEDKVHNFKKYNLSDVNSHGTPYDYYSVMQYSGDSFGINDSTTLVPISPNVIQLGQRKGLSPVDITQFQLMYDCKGLTTRKAAYLESYQVKGYYGCDFENGLCHFVNHDDDNFDWIQMIGNTPSGGTGPDGDHTTKRTGVFLYVEASLPRRAKEVARVSTRIFDATQSSCLRFFYHMFAANSSMMGRFRVYQQSSGISYQTTNLLDVSGSQGNKWIEFQQTLSTTDAFKIVFEGTIGLGYQGDIAIDDFSYSDGACSDDDKEPELKWMGDICIDSQYDEGAYCGQWVASGYCKLYYRDMLSACPKSCGFCS